MYAFSSYTARGTKFNKHYNVVYMYIYIYIYRLIDIHSSNTLQYILLLVC